VLQDEDGVDGDVQVDLVGPGVNEDGGGADNEGHIGLHEERESHVIQGLPEVGMGGSDSIEGQAGTPQAENNFEGGSDGGSGGCGEKKEAVRPDSLAVELRLLTDDEGSSTYSSLGAGGLNEERDKCGSVGGGGLEEEREEGGCDESRFVHRVLFELITHQRTIRVTVRGDRPCCLVKKVCFTSCNKSAILIIFINNCLFYIVLIVAC